MKKTQQDIIVLVDSDDPGGEIRRLRERAGLTQPELAFYLGVYPSTVYRWEKGDTAPDIRQARRIAEVVNRNWPKASKLSSPQEDYFFWFQPLPEFGIGLTPAA